MRWKYIKRGEFPELGDVCLIVKKASEFYVASYFPKHCYFSTTNNEEIPGENVVKWINIGEIKDSIEYGYDGGEHDRGRRQIMAISRNEADDLTGMRQAVEVEFLGCKKEVLDNINKNVEDL